MFSKKFHANKKQPDQIWTDCKTHGLVNCRVSNHFCPVSGLSGSKQYLTIYNFLRTVRLRYRQSFTIRISQHILKINCYHWSGKILAII